MTEHVAPSKASRMLGVTTKTLRQWHRDGKLSASRTPGGHRRISLEEIRRIKGEVDQDRSATLAYCRVSTAKQQENLERQVGRVLERCSREGWAAELFKDIGSGLNENRKALKRLLGRIPDRDVKRVVVEYKDRLARFGFETFVAYCQGFGVDVVVLEQAEKKEFEQELAEDMVALIASYSAKLYGRRGGRARHA
jgi:putative resolvase